MGPILLSDTRSLVFSWSTGAECEGGGDGVSRWIYR